MQHLMSELIREHSVLFSRENNRKVPGTSISAFASTHRQGSKVDWVYTKTTAPRREPQRGLNSDHVPQPAQTIKPFSRKFSLPLMNERRFSSQSSHTPHHLPEIQQQKMEVSSQASSALLYENHSPSPSAQESSHSGLVPPPTTPPTASSSSTITVAEVGHEGCLESTSWPRLGQCTWETEGALGDSSRSSEAQESTLSVYDNMVTGVQLDYRVEDGEAGTGIVDLEGGTARMADSTSSLSSCEILLGDGGSGSGGTASPCHSSVCFPSFRSDLGECDLYPNSPASSTAPTDAPLSTGSSEVFLPNGPSDSQDPPASQAIQCLVVGLRQQMARQKAEYEAKINR